MRVRWRAHVPFSEVPPPRRKQELTHPSFTIGGITQSEDGTRARDLGYTREGVATGVHERLRVTPQGLGTLSVLS